VRVVGFIILLLENDDQCTDKQQPTQRGAKSRESARQRFALPSQF
jgi:hypothetical protein